MMHPRVCRPRWLAWLLVSLLLAGLGGCKKSEDQAEPPKPEAAPAPEGRLVMLGFDGVDPDWVDRMVAEGKLPHLKKLVEADGGSGYRRLGSTNPPQSPVAWTSFATGTRPGEHGIFDFIRRKLLEGDSGLPLVPAIGTTEFKIHEAGPPSAKNLRNGIPFWKTLADDGVATIALNVPYSFPPDPMREGRMLSGLGVPDLRGTNSTFTYVGTDVTPEDLKSPPGGGALVALTLDGEGRGRFELEGPTIGKAKLKVPMEVWARPVDEDLDPKIEEDKSADDRAKEPPVGGMFVTVQGRTLRLEPREMSPWVQLKFSHEGRDVHGIVQLAVLEASKKATRLFVTPIGFDPKDPFSPISYPNAYAGELSDALGHLYKTVGWDHDTSALNAERIDEGLFLAQMDAIERDRRAMLMKSLGDEAARMLIWVSTSTDRVAHMFYRLIDPEHPMYDEALAKKYGSAIEREYRRMDETVGKVVATLGPHDTLLILSDHGFHNFRRGFHVNQWLRQKGYLVLKGGAEVAERELLLEVDWSATRAYALGTGQLYLNLRGRERDGVVNPEEAKALLEEIRTGLLAVTDDERGGVKVFDQVYLGSEVFKGARAADAPDLQLAFAEHYRTSWETILGGVPEGLFRDNDRKWSGDHAASDVADTAGILISNRPLADEVEIVDLAPTAFAFFGKEAATHHVGESVLHEATSTGKGKP